MKLVINERLKGKKLYKEVWKELTIKGVTYKVSNLGRIFGKTRELKQRLNKDGYLIVTVGDKDNRTSARVHRLVMMAFRPCEGMENLEVDHIDTCRTKNKLSNLRWTSHIENCNNPLSREHYSDCMIGDKNPFFGKTHTDEQKAKWSKERKGKKLSEEHRKKLSENSVWKGRKHTEEEIEKMRNNCSNKRQVRCIETGIVYPSIKEASRDTGGDSSSIGDCCKGKRKTCGKHPITSERLHWEYYEDNNE